MDIVIPYRRSGSNELRYMLRSLVNIEHDRVFIIGDRPILLQNVIYIPYAQTTDIAHNTFQIIKIACEDSRVSEDFILMSDDMFVMRKVESIPVRHRGTYRDVINAYSAQKQRGFYVSRMIATSKLLERLGFRDPLCYELHIPFVINKEKWLDICPIMKDTYNKLSIYGNFYKIGGEAMEDVKVRTSREIPRGDFISTFDTTFNTIPVGKYIRDTFPERSKYEKQYGR
jgi:hypothetical protein